MAKTALQQLIEFLDERDGLPTVMMMAKCRELLESERDQIMDAFMEGNEHPYEHNYDAYKYYQNTYNNEK